MIADQGYGLSLKQRLRRLTGYIPAHQMTYFSHFNLTLACVTAGIPLAVPVTVLFASASPQEHLWLDTSTTTARK